MQGKVQRLPEDLDKATCAGVSAMSGHTEWFPAAALPEAHMGTRSGEGPVPARGQGRPARGKKK